MRYVVNDSEGATGESLVGRMGVGLDRMVWASKR
jgi:hypothetical protein